MSGRLVTALASAAAAAVVVVGMPGFSTAAYTARTGATATVRAAADWAPPTVQLRNPGAPVGSTVTLAADAADSGSGLRSVTVQHRQGQEWVTVCTDLTAPYECAWDTTQVSDGTHQLRAEAFDRAGYSAVSATVTTVVANKVGVTLSSPGTDVRGTVPLTATLQNPVGSWSVRIEHAVAGTTSWKTVCTRAAAPYTCDWVTTGLVGQEYDLRAVAVSGGSTVASEVVPEITVDNTAPSVTVLDPGSPLRGSVTFAANATDAGSGVDTVVLQYAAAGTPTYRELCTVADEPWSCSYRTTQLADGTYTFRAVATDLAGNVSTSATVGNRVVDNTVTSVSVDDPGAVLRGTVVVTASANSTAGIASVRLQRAASGTSTWVDLCRDTTAPYSCEWDTSSVAEGTYDLRAVLVDGAGRSTTSAVVTGRRVDNSRLRGLDVQTSNGAGTAGRLDAGDTITYTFSQLVDPGSVTSGWTGAPLAVTIRLRDGALVGGSAKGDVVDVRRGSAAVNLGSLALREDFVTSGKTTLVAATMALGTTTVDGVTVSTVTLTAGKLTSGSVRTANSASATIWVPSFLVTDLDGRTCSMVPVLESGPHDREL
jgi:hypothetical protein